MQGRRWLGAAAVGASLLAGVGVGVAETCRTQSQMDAAERTALAGAAQSMALQVQAGNRDGLRAATIAEYAKDFGGIADTVAGAAPHLKGATPTVEQIYVLDATSNKKNADGTSPDAQFYCTLNKSAADAEFAIPGLPPGKYGFAMVRFDGAMPWRVSMLLRQDTAAGPWLLAGLYPRELTAGGHDGLWYWREARTLVAAKDVWNGYLYYREAQTLLIPAGFVSSTHLETLRSEMVAALPTVLVNGIGTENPMVLKGADGTEYRVTSIGPDDSLGKEKVDVALRLKVDALGDAAAARKRNLGAMSALVTAHPELKKNFHGVWVFTDAPGQSPVANEAAMEEIH